MRGGLLVVIALGGCDIVFHIDELPVGAGRALDAAALCSYVGRYGSDGAGLMRPCVAEDSPPTLELTGMVDTTANPSLCAYTTETGTAGQAVCVVGAHAITVFGTLVVTGDKPLALAALATITVDGAIDVRAGAGTSTGACKIAGAGGVGGQDPGGGAAGGGGGGGWQTRGGAGGLGHGGVAATAGTASAGVVDVRGGCPGGDGGAGSSPVQAAGGSGGGAIYLVAGTAISVTNIGSISASGRAGTASTPAHGGAGGGGSGGLIAFDSPSLAFQLTSAGGAKVFANGGGGGGSTTDGGTSSAPATGAIGGSPNGGSGALGQAAGANGTTGSSNGGGGGGGGQGYILFFSPGVPVLDAAHASPTPTRG